MLAELDMFVEDLGQDRQETTSSVENVQPGGPKSDRFDKDRPDHPELYVASPIDVGVEVVNYYLNINNMNSMS